MVAKFRWRSSGNAIEIQLNRFEDICLPKAVGGLGFKDFNKLNTSLFTKQVWRLMQDPTSYWASTLKAIYYTTSDFFCMLLWREALIGYGNVLFKVEDC